MSEAEGGSFHAMSVEPAGGAAKPISVDHLCVLFEPFVEIVTCEIPRVREGLADAATRALLRHDEAWDLTPILHFEAVLRAQFAIAMAGNRPTAILLDHAHAWGDRICAAHETRCRLGRPTSSRRTDKSGLLSVQKDLQGVLFDLLDYPSSDFFLVVAGGLQVSVEAQPDLMASKAQQRLVLRDVIGAARRSRHELPWLAAQCENGRSIDRILAEYDSLRATLRSERKHGRLESRASEISETAAPSSRGRIEIYELPVGS